MIINKEKLKKRFDVCGYESRFFDTRDELVAAVTDLTRGKSVGFGSSVTAGELGIEAAIQPTARKLFPHKIGETGDNERNSLTADFFITSANAVAMTGEIVNIDGTGNRVAATCFGPENILYIVGRNKICDDLGKAMDRAKETAVKLAQKYDRNTPCVKTGKCSLCFTAHCVCSTTVIHRKNPKGTQFHVYVLNEDIGL